MKLKALAAIVASLIVSVPTYGGQYENLTDLSLECESAILVDVDGGNVLYEHNSSEKLPPASITKIMTLLLVYEAERDGRISFTDEVSVSSHAASMGGSQVYLEEGERQSVEELVKCVSIASANDAAVALAEYIGGSEDGFVEMMNERAKELGMEDTTFKNACGLDGDGHLSSARDIAVMSAELLRNFPEITEYTTTWQDSLTHSTRRGTSEFGLTNTNKLVKWYEGATGLKTGSTSEAKYCLSASAKRGDMELVAVIMAAPDNKSRFSEAMELLDYGFANYATVTGAEKGDIIGEADVSKGTAESVELAVEDDIRATLPKGSAEPTLTVTVDELTAPVHKGDIVGKAVYELDGETLAEAEVSAAADVGRASPAGMFCRLIKLWCSSYGFGGTEAEHGGE